MKAQKNLHLHDKKSGLALPLKGIITIDENSPDLETWLTMQNSEHPNSKVTL